MEWVAVGGFDGVHLGHRAVIERAEQVLVIEKGSNLTPGRERCRYIPLPCRFLKLEEIAHLSPLQFIELFKRVYPNGGAVVGEDFRFGKGREGDIQLLARHLPVEVVQEVVVEGIPVHTRTIRQLLQSARLELANRLLGRFYSILGSPTTGQGLGSRHLLPTLNLRPDPRFLLPASGVYLMVVGGRPGVGFLGIRSTDSQFTLEAHLFSPPPPPPPVMRVHFIRYLRAPRSFSSLPQLKSQIEEDLQTALQIWEREGSKIIKKLKGADELRHRHLGGK